MGAYIWRDDLTESFLRYELGGLYLEGLIFGILRYISSAKLIVNSRVFLRARMGSESIAHEAEGRMGY